MKSPSPRILAALLLSLALLWGAVPARAQSVKPLIEMDHPVILAKGTSPVYLFVQFDVAQIKEDSTKPRPRLNLAMVIDRSGSMEDKGKMEYAREAAKILVDRLKPTDRLAIVEYDDQIAVLWPSSPVETPDLIKKSIDSLYPRGSTNLTGGMLKGCDEAQKNLDPEGLNRVILLSDGLANQGVTNPQEIKRLVRERKGKGVRISAMGLGADYNEDLMQAIAENGGGNYYFIESPKQMGRIFEQELGTLFATVAKDVTLTFDAAAPVMSVEVYGYLSSTEGKKTKVEMENFYSEEKRSLVMRLETAPTAEGKTPLGKLALSYKDMLSDKPETIVKEIEVMATKDPAQVSQSENKEAVIESTLAEADREHEKYIQMYEKGDKKDALENMKKLSDKLAEKNAKLSDVKLGKKIEALQMEAEEIKEAEQDATQKALYLKKSKQRFYQAKKGKRSQSILQEGDSGMQVERIQKALADKGFYKGKIDGKFTPELTAAVKAYQKSEKMTVDGVVGPATMKKLGAY